MVSCRTPRDSSPVPTSAPAASRGGNTDSTLAPGVLPVVSSDSSSSTNTPRPSFPPDTNVIPPKPSPFEDKVEYKARDSVVFDVSARIMYLYDSVTINYQNIHLESGHVVVNLEIQQLHAEGKTDSLGRLQGKPYFKEREDAFFAKTIDYNFRTRKGLITEAFSTQDQLFIHGRRIKKDKQDVLYIRHAQFTSCSEPEHPHFDIATSRAKVIPNDKVVTGPAVLRINSVPTPLALPFGFFPSQSKRSSGIILPEYGEQANYGFFLRNFGYYFNLSDKMDLTLYGDIFTSLSFGIRGEFRYNSRYKHDGRVGIKFSQFQRGDPQVPEDFQRSRDFSIQWVHNQSPKAHPTFNFKANVNIQTGGFNRLNAGSVTGIVQNQFNSNINITKTFRGTPFNLSASLRHFQNTSTGALTMSLPEVVFNMSRVNPFRRRIQTGRPKWYENIGLTYRMMLGNQINTIDSLFVRDPVQEILNANAGIRHEAMMSTSVTVMKYIFLTPSMRYDERWHLRNLQKGFDPQNQTIKEDTLRGFFTTRQLDLSVSASTNVFSTLYFKQGRLKGLRHTLTPNLSFVYRPDLGDHHTGFYGPGGTLQTYSPNQIGLYGAPPQGQSGMINLSLQNRVEAKVGPGRKDTLETDGRVAIIEQFSVNTSYDMARDSLNLSNLVFSGRTTLFKGLGLNMDMAFDPYRFVYQNGSPVKIDEFEITSGGPLMRLVTVGFALNYSIRGESRRSAQDMAALSEEEKQLLNDPYFNRYFVDFNVPYSFTFNYNIRYSRPYDRGTTTHTVGVSGDVNITPRWKVGFNVNYDIANAQITTSSFDIYRDLHCWELRFSVIPFGFRQSYSFTINVKSPMLQGLKLNRQRGWFNN